MKKHLITVDCSNLMVGDDGDTTHYGGTVKITDHYHGESQELNCDGETDRGNHPGMQLQGIVLNILAKIQEYDPEDIVDEYFDRCPGGIDVLDQEGKVWEIWGPDSAMEFEEFLNQIETREIFNFKSVSSVMEFLRENFPGCKITKTKTNLVEIQLPENLK